VPELALRLLLPHRRFHTPDHQEKGTISTKEFLDLLSGYADMFFLLADDVAHHNVLVADWVRRSAFGAAVHLGALCDQRHVHYDPLVVLEGLRQKL
jgi:hypothetical protein